MGLVLVGILGYTSCIGAKMVRIRSWISIVAEGLADPAPTSLDIEFVVLVERQK